MKEQKYEIKNIKSFELADIFDCGQCFRWNKQEDGSYTGIFKGNVMNVQNQKSCHVRLVRKLLLIVDVIKWKEFMSFQFNQNAHLVRNS